MKRLFTCLGLTLLTLTLAAVGAWFYITSQLDAHVLAAIEREGSAMTGAPVTVESVSISLREGTGVVRGLSIANPHGFPEGPAIELDEVSLTMRAEDQKVDVKGGGQSKVVLGKLVLKSPRVNYTLDAEGNSNIAVLQKNIKRSRGADSTTPEPDSESLLLEVRTLLIEGTEVAVDASAVGGESLSVEVDPIEMEGLGSPDGLPPKQVGDLVLSEITSRTTTAVAKKGVLTFLEGKLGEGAKDLGNSLMKKVFGK